MPKAIAIAYSPNSAIQPLLMAYDSLTNSLTAMGHAMYGTQRRANRTLFAATLLLAAGAFMQSPLTAMTQCAAG